jgi:hypothetical protein
MKPPSANTEAGICLPGEQTWELWKHGSSGWQSTQAENSPAAFKTAAVFGYPVSAAFALPIRAATGDDELLPDIVDFQLEKVNLKPETPVGRLMDWRLVEREENRTLLLASVLNSEMADDLPKGEAPQRFEISPYLYYLPDDHLVIWKELGRLVFAVTRGDQPVYFHALNAQTFSTATVAEIEQLLMPLYTQEIITHLEGIVFWTEDVQPGAAEELSRTFNTRVRTEKRPKPTLPQTVSPLEPVSVAMEKIRAARMRRIRNIVAACLLAYLAIPGFFAVRWFLAKQDNDKLRARVQTMRTNYGNVKSTLDQWEFMKAVTNADRYPIDLFYHIMAPLYQPNSRVRLQSIDIHRDLKETGEKISITVKGESDANNLTPITVYVTRIKGTKELKDFNWENPGGAEGPSGIHTFTLTGNLKADESATPTP